MAIFFAYKVNIFKKVFKNTYYQNTGIRRFESPYPLRRLYGPYFPLSSYPSILIEVAMCKRRFLLAVFFISAFIIFHGVFLSDACAQEEGFLKAKIEKIEGLKKNSEDEIKIVLRNFDVPKEIGFVKEIHVPSVPASKMVINIQDLHCNYQAQKNIAAILDYLVRTYNLKVVSVEGGSGKIDTKFYKDLPDKKIKEQVADYFLREARINGTEYYAITTEDDIALYGAEDEKYYDQNLDAFLKALPQREVILENIALLENGLNILKNRIYNKKLKELDDRVVAYENGEVGFEDYIAYVVGLYPENKFRREFTQLPQLYDSILLKNKLDLKEAEKQRNELIDLLTKSLGRLELEDFLKVTVEFKAKTLDAVVYHNTIKKLYDGMQSKSKSFDRAWPDLAKYVEYLNKHETLDKFMLFTELDKLLDSIKDQLYTSYTQKKLDQNLRLIRLARNLFSTKLLNKDLVYVKKYRDQFSAKEMRKFIETESRRLKIEATLPGEEELAGMEKTLPDIENFYYYASKRNEILAQNTLSGMEKEGQAVGVLVTGGFHTDGIGDYFKENRIVYAVICPVIDKLEDDDQRYIDALKGKKTPFERMMENENTPARDIYFDEKE